ncbi:hypothetical protein DFP74_4082 [Nocardiopsis sp. Huas11]|nr:hypothetical protein DFP74_4082 [Nocardiopsis sp. Huas11]
MRMRVVGASIDQSAVSYRSALRRQITTMHESYFRTA